jgi:hypothetical protein
MISVEKKINEGKKTKCKYTGLGVCRYENFDGSMTYNLHFKRKKRLIKEIQE